MFKVQKTFKSNSIKKPVQQYNQIAVIPTLSFTLKQQTLLHYNIEDLIAIVDSFFEQQIQQSSTNISITVKAMSIVSCSLNDGKITKRLNEILSQFVEKSNSISKSQSVYVFFACCFQRNIQICKIIDKLQTKLKISVIAFLFSQYFYGSRAQNFPDFHNSFEQLVNIGKVQQIIDTIFSQCSNSFMQTSISLKTILKRVSKITFKSNVLSDFLKKNLQFIISKRQKQFSELVQFYIEQDTTKTQIVILLDQLVKNYQSLSTTIQQSFKNVISPNNLLHFNEKITGKQLQSLFRGARRQWVNDQNNWWNFINQSYHQVEFKKRNLILSIGLKQIDSPQQFNESITVKYLYDFFYNKRQINIQQSEGQVAFLTKLTIKNQCVVDMSKALLNSCTQTANNAINYKIIQINTIYYPKNWKILSLQAIQTIKVPQAIQQQFENFIRLFKKTREIALANGKKIELAAVVISFTLKSTPQKAILLTINQFIKFLVEDSPQLLNDSFQNQLPLSFKNASKNQLAPKVSSKKEQIVIEALIVKYMKRNHQQSFSIQKLSQKFEIEAQICAKAMLSLTRKGLVEKSEQVGKQQQFVYLA